MKKYFYYYWSSMVSGGTIMTIFSFFHSETIFNVFFNICLGLFIGGILMSIISIILSEMATNDHADHFDHVDHVDHIDHFDHVDHVDHFDHVDHVDHIDHFDHVDHVDHFDHVDHVDHFDHVDHVDHFDHVDHADHFDHVDHVDHADHFDDTGDSAGLSDPTPAPFMLLFSTHLLVFGISGIIFYFIIANLLKFMIFFLTPVVAYIITLFISIGWKKMAKSRYYTIASTKNLIGKKGEVILGVDNRGGVIKIPSYTPMRFERIHVKPLKPDSRFEKGEKVYICDVKNGFLLVDHNKNLIKNRRF
ncbi:MAG: hypothetical protein ACFFAH_05555 [Promethearchaeota archaeon]